MRQRGFVIECFGFPSVLKAATRVKALSQGMEVHGFGIKMGFVLDPFVQTGLVSLYASCGCVEDARLVFDKMSERDVVAWNIMIDGYNVSLYVHVGWFILWANYFIDTWLKTYSTK